MPPGFESPQVVSAFYEGQEVGRIVDLGNATLWEWTPSFVKKGLELSPVVPLGVARATYSDPYFHRLPPLLADSLPDSYGLGIMNERLRQWGYTNITTLDRLAYVGQSGMGALYYAPAFEEEEGASSPTVEDLQRYAEQFKTDPGQVDWRVLKRTTNLGGAQPKSAVSYHPESDLVQTGVKTDDGFIPMIVKFQFEPGDGQTQAEHALARLARACGVQMPPTRLIEDRGYQHFAVERFDVTETGKRLHYQSYAAITGNQYLPFHSPDYIHLIQEVKKQTLHYQDSLELFRRMVFGIIVHNGDDHQRNHGFLMNEHGEWRLSPAFDINYTMPGSNDSRACTVNRKGFQITRDDCLEVAKAASLADPDVGDIFDQIREGLRRWGEIADSTGMPDSLRHEMESGFQQSLL